ncbi:MAG: DNA-directed RNA polymerase subunit omega [Chitinispirillales bacterium]|jgi:DNA-directed RNA polymerase subunit K/omega|nr:DNA-directed RNA polymerase subunit omega [Chitinispirillales bacterium]
MSELYELELESLEKKGVSRYKAVLMASQEARFVNNQLRMGIVESRDKPTTLAMRKLFEGRVVEDVEEQAV